MFAVMHGIAQNLGENELTISPFTPVKEFSITQGAFLTRLMAKNYINPVVLFTNVSPHQEYKTDVIGKTKNKDIIFVGANTGVFDWLVRDFGLEYLVQITKRKPYIVDGELVYLPGEDAPADYDSRFLNKSEHLTFAAHTILGAIAVALSFGIDYRKFGETRDSDFIVPLDIKSGEIVHIDNYGNAKIYGSVDFNPDTELKILKDDKLVAEGTYINGRMMSRPTGSYALYPSTSLPNMVDLALIRGDACKELGLKIGDVLTFLP